MVSVYSSDSGLPAAIVEVFDSAVTNVESILHAAMQQAVQESVSALGISTPNPAVGAVIISPSGQIVGVGHTQAPGSDHAEIVALADAGARARGAVLVVTLEPCNHIGRTGPCAQALIAAGIAAVVFAVTDPNPQAAGGAAYVEKFGVPVLADFDVDEVASGPLAGWLFRQEHDRPLIIGKIASSLDGRVAAADGTSQWITGELARQHAHQYRSYMDAVVVGTTTVLVDDPQLTARMPGGQLYPHQPQRIVLGKSTIPNNYLLHKDIAGVAPVKFTASHDITQVIEEWNSYNMVLIEGGPKLLGSFLTLDYLDQIYFYQAPCLLGTGKSAIDAEELNTLTKAKRFRWSQHVILGDDRFSILTRYRSGQERVAHDGECGR